MCSNQRSVSVYELFFFSHFSFMMMKILLLRGLFYLFPKTGCELFLRKIQYCGTSICF